VARAAVPRSRRRQCTTQENERIRYTNNIDHEVDVTHRPMPFQFLSILVTAFDNVSFQLRKDVITDAVISDG